MQTSSEVGGTTRTIPPPLLKMLTDHLQTFFTRRADSPVSPSHASNIETLQRDALRYLTSQRSAESLGDYLDFGVAARPSLRCMAQVLNDLRFDDVRTLSFDSKITPALRHKYRLRKASVVRIASDLQASTADVLHSVEPLIHDQTVVLFDHGAQGFGQLEAFDEFLRARPGLTARPLPANASDTYAFVITRAPTV
jgi:hypothetical protein